MKEIGERYCLIIKTDFSAAHDLILKGGIEEGVHGHDWKISACWEIEETKYNELSVYCNEILKDIISRFDHTYLNDLSEFVEQAPSTEIIANKIFDEISERDITGAALYWIEIEEESGHFARYRKDNK